MHQEHWSICTKKCTLNSHSTSTFQTTVISELPQYVHTRVMIYHRGASLSEQHTDLLQDLSHTSRYVDESSPEIARCRIRMPTAKTATLSVTTYA